MKKIAADRNYRMFKRAGDPIAEAEKRLGELGGKGDPFKLDDPFKDDPFAGKDDPFKDLNKPEDRSHYPESQADIKAVVVAMNKEIAAIPKAKLTGRKGDELKDGDEITRVSRQKFKVWKKYGLVRQTGGLYTFKLKGGGQAHWSR
jgi:hypothetical protein